MTSLCSLPFELIEEISRFFKRSESVRVLRVNSVLHEAFARRIWRHITSSEGTVWNAPPSAWTHYGPLVRTLSIMRYIPVGTKMPSLPNLLKLVVLLDEGSIRIFEHDMPLLQTASIRLSGLFKRADLLIMAAWISDVEKRAQDVAVEWKLVTGGETTSQMDVILDAITKPELHSFNIRLVQSIYEFEQKSKFAAMMVEIRLPHAAMGVKPSLLNEVLSWKGVVFSRLRRLNLHLLVYKVEHGNGNDLDEDEGWYDVSDEEDAADDNDMNGDDGNVPTFPASRFPALESLNIVMLGGYVNVLQCGIDHRFFSDVESTVTVLELSGCDHDACISIMNYAPQLKYLYFRNSKFILNTQFMARNFPQLEQLHIDDYCNIDIRYEKNDDGRDYQLVNLHTFRLIRNHTRFDSSWPTGDDLKFILRQLPNLITLDISARDFSKQIVGMFSGEINESVRHLHVHLVKKCDEICYFRLLELLPNLESFQCWKLSRKTLVRLQERYPKVKCHDTHDDNEYDEYDDDEDIE